MKATKPYIINDVRSIIKKTNELAKLEQAVIEAEKKVSEKASELVDAKIQLTEDMNDEKRINVQLCPNEIIQITKSKGPLLFEAIPIHIRSKFNQSP